MRVAALAATTLLLAAAPAEACLTCGCSGSGISGDVAAGGNAFLFSNCARLIVQQGLSLRTVTGSFTETGAWTPTPTNGRLDTLQGAFSAMWFPTTEASLTVSLPLVANRLDKATWGPLGSVAPTEIGVSGAGVGDVGLQGSYKLYQADDGLGLAGWAGATLPSGASTGEPAALTGSGVLNAQGGLVGMYRLGFWQLSANLGYQRPLTSPPLTGTTFYVGNAWLYQLQAAHTFNPGLTNTWSVGMGLQGYRGEGRFGPNDVPFATGKLRVVPSVQYEFDMLTGLRVSAGVDPFVGGTNAMTDVTVMTTFYQGFNP